MISTPPIARPAFVALAIVAASHFAVPNASAQHEAWSASGQADAQVGTHVANAGDVNVGGATGRDFLELIGFVRDRVHDACGVELELEVEIWS